MSKAVNSKWKKTFPDTIGNQNRPAEGVDDTQPFETGAFPQYMANDPVRYDLQNAAMSQSMSNDARLKEMVDARGKELDDHKVDPGAHKAGIAGNAATATKVVANAAAGNSANIAEATMAGSDSARIRVSGDDNAGELALETADNGNEAIVARQYTGDFKDVARTAAILDANGNTSFPGTVVAPKFTGELNGNAATASKLLTPRTISLTGKAAGSTSFDGSANASINVKSVNADTASKLSTARKINITGNATGAANFDGSGDVNISVTVNESKHAATATAVNATAPNGGAADLAFGTMAVNDYARIRVYGKDDNGALEIATADGGNEPIYARQYGGAYDWPNGRPGTVMNEAAILDSNGNTKFPKNVTAASFTGPLNGNAATADRAKFLQVTEGGGRIDDGKFYWVGKDGQPMWLWGSNTLPSETYVYNPSNFHVAAANNDGNGANIANTYLKRSGGTMTGALNFVNSKWNLVGDDSYMGDHDIIGTFCIKGANGETGIALVNKANEADYARISYGGGNINFNKTIGGNITGNAATATKATQDTNGRAFADTNAYMHIRWLDNGTDFNNVKTTGIYYCTKGTFANKPYNTWGILTVYSIGTVKQEYRPDNAAAYYTRVYNNSNWTAWSKVAASTADSATTATNADKLDGYHASDIINRITAANTGGIVAAALDTNGYVKFANGLTVQWGYLGTTHTGDMKVTFPIAFKTIFNLVCDMIGLCTGSSDNGSLNIQSYNTTGASFFNTDDHDGTGLFWRAVGIV